MYGRYRALEKRLDKLRPCPGIAEDLSDAIICIFGQEGVAEIERDYGEEFLKEKTNSPNTPPEISEEIKKYLGRK